MKQTNWLIGVYRDFTIIIYNRFFSYCIVYTKKSKQNA